jgi:hypothetical protein
MTIKIKVIEESLTRAEKRISYLKSIIYAKPASKIIECRQQAHKILTENKGDYEKISELIKTLANEEKEQFRIAKKQEKANDLIHELVDLENEVVDLRSELYFEERRRIYSA